MNIKKNQQAMIKCNIKTSTSGLKKTGKLGMVALGEASEMLDKYRANKGSSKVEIPPEKTKSVDNLNKF